jgi:lipopolysaccharide export LptBFGC system permease protein LptF
MTIIRTLWILKPYAWQYARLILLIFVGLMMLTFVIDGMEHMRHIKSTTNWLHELSIVALRIPRLGLLFGFFSAIIAGVITFIRLQSDILILRTFGQSPKALARPFVLVAGLWGLIFIGLYHPLSITGYRMVKTKEGGFTITQKTLLSLPNNALWLWQHYPGHNPYYLHSHGPLPGKTGLKNVSVYNVDPQTHTLTQQAHYDWAKLTPNNWYFSDGTTRPTTDTPRTLGAHFWPPHFLTLPTLWQKHTNPHLPNRALYTSALYQHLCYPLWLMLLISILTTTLWRPHKQRTASYLNPVCLTLLLSFGFYMFQKLIFSLCGTGQLPAIYGAFVTLFILAFYRYLAKPTI